MRAHSEMNGESSPSLDELGSGKQFMGVCWELAESARPPSRTRDVNLSQIRLPPKIFDRPQGQSWVLRVPLSTGRMDGTKAAGTPI